MRRLLSLAFGEHGRWFVLAFVISAVVTWAWLDGRQNGIDTTTAHWRQAWAEQEAMLAKEREQAERLMRLKEHAWQKSIEDVRNESKKQIEQARADAAAADAVADRLHEQARRLAAAGSQCASNSTATIRSKAARATNAVVLADVFARADAAAGQLAAAYDRARAAGLACERSYDALRNAKDVP